jgi:uncharacterized protein (DUF2141 family)
MAVRTSGTEERVFGQKVLASFLTLVVCSSLPARAALPAGDMIRVEVSGFRSDKGQVVCSLFASADGYPKKDEKAVAHAKGTITDKKGTCEFAAPATGTYAVSVFHDENSNGKMDTNFIGMPKEGVGASNDAKGHMGPPKFEAAAFKYVGGELTLKVTIHYL